MFFKFGVNLGEIWGVQALNREGGQQTRGMGCEWMGGGNG